MEYIIENSIEAMRNRQRILNIDSRVSDRYVEVNISDTGLGIPKDKLKSVMEPFYTSKIYGGLGLPLALKIIHAHRGTISVKSKLNKGTTFTAGL